MSLQARTRWGDLRIEGRGTVMARCLAAGLPVASACSGRGACARCAMAVLEGAKHLSPVTSHEALVLRRNGLLDGVRLSCQVVVLDPGAEVLLQAGYW